MFHFSKLSDLKLIGKYPGTEHILLTVVNYIGRLCMNK